MSLKNRFAQLPRRAARAAIVLVLASLVCGAPPAAGGQLFTTLDVAFEDGAVLPDLHIAFDTDGKLSPARDNAILLLPGALGDRHVFDALVGPGRTFDTDRYFVITVDPLGGGESSSPADGLGQNFPRYTIRDMMEAQLALVTRGLHLSRLHALVGMSMGSFVALEWGVHHPETLSGLILMAPSPKADANFRLTVDLANATIALDPEWQGGRYTHNPVEGLRHAGMVLYPWVVSARYIERLRSRELAKELEAAARSFAAWDANALVLRHAAYRAHDVTAPYDGDLGAALARVTMPTLILANPADRFVDIAGARRIRDGIAQASYVEIPSDLGHHAIRALPGTPEGDQIDRSIREFLAKLAAVPAD